jgi:hypothetical protein
VSDKKVVGIDSKKPEPCFYCGAIPSHPHLSCPRIKCATLFEDGTLEGVEYFKPGMWEPPSGGKAA